MKLPPYIKKLIKFCGTESSRYSLGGVKCESDGENSTLTATDGKVLATVRFKDDGPTFDVAVNGKDLAAIKGGESFDGTAIQSGKTKFEPEIIAGGRFPEYERFFPPSLEGYVGVRLDAALLRKLCDLSHELNKSDTGKGITLFVKDADSCVIGTTRSEDGHVARFCIMPCVSDLKPEFP